MRIVLFILILVSGSFAAAQTTQPASLEQSPLTQSGRATLQSLPRAGASGGGELLNVSQLFVGLLIVISLIFATKWVLPKVWPAVAAQRNTAVRVLGRTAVSPKNQIVLVQVGQRVLVLGETTSQLTTLAAIDNADEVALLVGRSNNRIERESDSAFSAALAESNRAYEPTAATMDTSVTADEPAKGHGGELSDLISKVRGLARQINRS